MADAEAGRYHEALGMTADELSALKADAMAYNRQVSLGLFKHYIAADLDAFAAEYRQYCERYAKLR